MTSPPNFLSFGKLNGRDETDLVWSSHAFEEGLTPVVAALNNTSRLNSPIQSPFLSPFPSSPSSPGLEPRRTKSRHMDTFSFFDAKPQSPGPMRENNGPVQSPFFNDHGPGTNHYPQVPPLQIAQSQPPQLNRWDSFQSNPSSPYPGSRAMTPGGTRNAMPRVCATFSSSRTFD